MTESIDPRPARTDVISVVGERIKNITDQETRDLIWALTSETYNMGVSAGKSYQAQITEYDAQASAADTPIFSAITAEQWERAHGNG